MLILQLDNITILFWKKKVLLFQEFSLNGTCTY